jgi:hypothetical protein
MKAVSRVCLVALLAALALPAAAHAQRQEAAPGDPIPATLKAQVVERYRVLVIRDGIVLTPRAGSGSAVEITAEGIALDGQPVSGRELRDRLGPDASLVLQLSYTDNIEALRAAFGAPQAAAPPATEVLPAPQPPAPPEPPAAPAEDPDERRWTRSGSSRVRVMGGVHVAEDEHMRDEVVAILGPADIEGRVDGDVVSVLGGVRLGPRAVVNGQVVSVGYPITREAGAQVRGDVVEVAFAPAVFAPMVGFRGAGSELFSDWARLMGTGLRIAVLLLITLAVVAVARGPVSRIARRAGDDPWVCGFVGLAAQVLFVPVLVVTIVILAISIIGIPLLLLIPFAIVGLLLGVLMGFAGVARRVGEWVVGSDRSAMVATAVGVVLIVAGAILARLLWLIPGPIGPVAFVVATIGLFLEYIAWTVGLGALLLTRFGTQRPAYPTATWDTHPATPLPASDAP